MADTVRPLAPNRLYRNPENPRLVFREDELEDLRASIEKQGILVPLTVYQDGNKHILLDGERRWRCALKLGLSTVPVIVQPKPDRLQNIMMMFAIHKARQDWDPLPTAYKLQDLEKLFARRYRRHPTELELARLASITRGEVRRLKKLLELPESYRHELMKELEKPRSQQLITVDHVLEATAAAAALRKRDILRNSTEEDQFRKAIISKFRTTVIKNTVAPRKLARLARAVERREIPLETARDLTRKLTSDPAFSIEDAFRPTEQADFQHNLSQLALRLRDQLIDHESRRYRLSDALRTSLVDLVKVIRRLANI